MTAEAHLQVILRLLKKVGRTPIEPITQLLFESRRASGKVVLAGNGGSAANASHFALHLTQCGFDARCLDDGTPLLTALANDFGYAAVFRRALPDGFRSGDLAVILSCSGDSPNVLMLALEARKAGAKVLGLLGSGGGLAGQLCDVAFKVDSADAAAVEDVHSVLLHILTKALGDTGMGKKKGQ